MAQLYGRRVKHQQQILQRQKQGVDVKPFATIFHCFEVNYYLGVCLGVLSASASVHVP